MPDTDKHVSLMKKIYSKKSFNDFYKDNRKWIYKTEFKITKLNEIFNQIKNEETSKQILSHILSFKKLKKYCENQNQPISSNEELLLVCIQSNNNELFSILITLYNNLVLSEYEKQFLLHLTAQEGRANIVELLLKNKADINANTSKGFTALHLVTQKGEKNCYITFKK
ncbi:ankyrin repeat domain-containing protein [Spiroplasma sp. AdecLV25b]|uniref:ankyrin repeat domain-containing protein n=1 Tax=Spiroplasma sp. AdecLV25b TaxID=3027162 RepID=UPI0027DF4D9E|nr:ankyrin repeat domain-containing protein [Spiroplasma sp. AdecLV25b]